jgi:3-phenylpropionate/cinnamic acid dioxygenase small subunit
MIARRQVLCGLCLGLTAGTAAARPPPTREMHMSSDARLQRLEDIEAIRRLLTDYGRDLDRRDFKAYSELFATDGVWDGGFGAAKGPAEIQAMMEKSIGGKPITGPQSNFHLLTNFEIEVHGDTGQAWSRWTFVAQDPDKRARILYAGRYDDELVREAGRWKFKRRTVSGDLPGQPPPQGPLSQ